MLLSTVASRDVDDGDARCSAGSGDTLALPLGRASACTLSAGPCVAGKDLLAPACDVVDDQKPKGRGFRRSEADSLCKNGDGSRPHTACEAAMQRAAVVLTDHLQHTAALFHAHQVAT